MDDRRVRAPGAAFLVAQVGGHSARLWVSRLGRAGLDAREVMLFRHVAVNRGRSQREVADAIGLPASRIVAIVNRLEDKGWIERKASTTDRRTNALYLTSGGEAALARIMTISREHEAELLRSLDESERSALIRILDKVAADHGLIEGVHPGFSDTRADQTAPDGAE